MAVLDLKGFPRGVHERSVLSHVAHTPAPVKLHALRDDMQWQRAVIS